jgi:hypothetical protein
MQSEIIQQLRELAELLDQTSFEPTSSDDLDLGFADGYDTACSETASRIREILGE